MTSDIKIPESVNVGRNATRSGRRRPESDEPDHGVETTEEELTKR